MAARLGLGGVCVVSIGGSYGWVRVPGIRQLGGFIWQLAWASGSWLHPGSSAPSGSSPYGPGHLAAGRFHLAARLGIWQLAPSWQLGSIWQLSIWVVGWGGVVSGFFRSLVKIFPKFSLHPPYFQNFLVVFICRRPKNFCQEINQGDPLPLIRHLEK